MQSERYFDPDRKHLVYVQAAHDRDFWDDHWSCFSREAYRSTIPPSNLVANETRKYLSRNSLVLEGGAGRGENIWYLHLDGYRPVALDFAPCTARRLQKAIPEVNPIVEDVRHLPFKDASFDAYWSLGVIEHFPDGYSCILSEIRCALRPGGYLFLTFPYMNPLRKLKARLGFYPIYSCQGEDTKIRSHFYQFALDHKTVFTDLLTMEFKPVRSRSVGGIKGLKDEIPFTRPLLQKLFDYKGASLLLRSVRYFFNYLLLPSFAGHMKFSVWRLDK